MFAALKENRMNTIKNFLYNISDILIALLIIAIAAFIIGWRVDAIMQYPQTLSIDQTAVSKSSGTDSSHGNDVEDEQIPTDKASDNTAAQDVTVTVVQNDTVTIIAQSLVDAGAITDAQQFIDAVNAAGAATKLKFGTYKIPAGATVEEILQMMM